MTIQELENLARVGQLKSIPRLIVFIFGRRRICN
jgi:hypothetical protein